MIKSNLLLLFHAGQYFRAILLYAGPDQLLPLMSVLGAIIGVLLIVWQRLVGIVRRVFQFFTERLPPASRKKV